MYLSPVLRSLPTGFGRANLRDASGISQREGNTPTSSAIIFARTDLISSSDTIAERINDGLIGPVESVECLLRDGPVNFEGSL